ncbi:uncharacterized protein [Coffea arabica]|uniref:DNA glycosylase At3g47830 n=1 Tax=Coffea arabica TaxID=13443 RepID=A0A6P6TC99_COFAR|nr:uncharacterized protein LOC113699926 [Coffea arabica]
MTKKTTICSKLYMPLKDYPTFNLEKAVCNHGFFMMAPNVWDPSTKQFTRPLRLSDSVNSVKVTISQPHDCSLLLIEVHDMECISDLDKEAIRAQVARMMRLSPKDEKDLQEFQNIHPKFKNMGFGRIFRAPSFFEDVVKSMLLCFCSLQNSLTMAKMLCDLQSELSNGLEDNNSCTQGKGLKRKRNVPEYFPESTRKIQSVRNFPSAKELAGIDVEILKDHCKLGLRAKHIHEFAKDYHRGRYRLRNFEKCASHEELYQKLMKIKGCGAYVSNNVLMCLGFYEKVPIDTETVRHLQECVERGLGIVIDDNWKQPIAKVIIGSKPQHNYRYRILD